MGSKGGSLASRALIALVLLVGYYVLGIVVALALIAVPIAELALFQQLHVALLALPLLGLSVLWSLVPRRTKWVDPGPRFDATTQPELTALVQRVATGVGQPLPADLYLLDEVNAFVTTRGGFLGLGGRRVLAVGVPLMTILDTDELASVLAHEFGHLDRGDTRLGPLIYRARSAMGRSLGATSGVLHGVFKAYAAFYLRRTQAISRRQEHAADQLAASVTSPATTAAALTRLVVGSPAFDFYWREEYAPIVRAGRRPPYLAGFLAVLTSTAVTEHAEQAADVALGLAPTSVYDSHPPIAERVRALGIDPGAIPYRPRPPYPATTILRDLEAVEASLVQAQVQSAAGPLPTIPWEDVGREVLLPAWRAEVAELLAPAAPGLAPADVPVTADQLAALGDAVYRHRGRAATRPEREAIARRLCQHLLGVAAADRGWHVEAWPGEPLQFRYEGAALAVVDDYVEVCAGRLDADGWRQQVRVAGLATPAGMGAAAGSTAPPPAAGQSVPPVSPVPDAAAYPAYPTAAVGAPGAGPAVDPPGLLPPAPSASPDAPLWFKAKPPGQLSIRKKELIIAGPELRWGDQVAHADQVAAVAYSAVAGTLTFRATAPTGEVHLKLKTNGRVPKGMAEAWQAALSWSQRYVEPRLVDGLVEQIQAAGGLEIDGVMFTPEGITTKKGSWRWDQIAGATFNGGDVELFEAADNLDGRRRVGRIRGARPGAVLVPQLCETIVAMRSM